MDRQGWVEYFLMLVTVLAIVTFCVAWYTDEKIMDRLDVLEALHHD